MGKYFVYVKQGDIRDLSFRKKIKISENCNLYHVYLDDLCIGQVHPGRCNGWDAISYRDHDKLYSEHHEDVLSDMPDETAEVLGFVSRLAGGFYLASHWKLRPERLGEKK